MVFAGLFASLPPTLSRRTSLGKLRRKTNLPEGRELPFAKELALVTDEISAAC